MVGLAVANTVAGYAAAKRSAPIEEAQVRQGDALQQQAITAQQQQIQAQAVDQMSVRAKQAMVERGRLEAISAESGAYGNTQDRIMNESYHNQGVDMASIEGNRRGAMVQSQNDRQMVNVTSNRQLSGIKQPSLLGAGLQIGGAVAYADKQPPSKSPRQPQQQP
jgi:hypothetical protein